MSVRHGNLSLCCFVFAFLLFVQGTFGIFGIGENDNGTTTTMATTPGGGGGTTTSTTPTKTAGGGGPGKAYAEKDADNTPNHSKIREKRQQTNQQQQPQQQQQPNLESLPVCPAGQSPIAPIPPAGPSLPIGAIPPTVVCFKCRPSNGQFSATGANGA